MKKSDLNSPKVALDSNGVEICSESEKNIRILTSEKIRKQWSFPLLYYSCILQLHLALLTIPAFLNLGYLKCGCQLPEFPSYFKNSSILLQLVFLLMFCSKMSTY